MVRICTLVTGLFLCLWTVLAQKPGFEAASIKPNISGQDGGSVGPQGDRLVATNVPLKTLLHFAYAPATGVLLTSSRTGAGAPVGARRTGSKGTAKRVVPFR